MEAEATKVMTEGAAAWPRTFTSHGDPATDALYRKIARSKGHNIPIPSHQSFFIETRVKRNELQVVILSRAKWAYAIRSYQVGETESQSRERFKWNRGQTEEQYRSQKQLGRKRHAWSTLMVRPFKKASKRLVEEITGIIEGAL